MQYSVMWLFHLTFWYEHFSMLLSMFFNRHIKCPLQEMCWNVPISCCVFGSFPKCVTLPGHPVLVCVVPHCGEGHWQHSGREGGSVTVLTSIWRRLSGFREGGKYLQIFAGKSNRKRIQFVLPASKGQLSKNYKTATFRGSNEFFK